MTEPRTFKVTSPLMRGSDIESFQAYILDRFRQWNINYPVTVDGVYGVQTRSAIASFLRAWGAESTVDLMAEGVSPWLRIKIRDDRRSELEKENFESPEYKAYRAALRAKFKDPSDKGSYPFLESHLVTDDWDYHGRLHDGVDLVCPWKEPILAVCRAKVVDVRSGDNGDRWWGKGAAPSAGHPISDGDGIVIIQVLGNLGPFIDAGDCFGYGHSEKHIVNEGDVVEAGQRLGYAGWANGPHVHFMQNGGTYLPTQGLGDKDPKPALNWLKVNF